jgi:serine/threonine protein phosphatase PrpC
MTTLSGKQSLGDREAQEDAFRMVRQSEEDPKSDILLLLADGMGGHVGGEIASNLALEAFERHFASVSTNPKPRLRLKESLLAANVAIAARIKENPQLAGMGCTLVGALKLGDRLIWVSVGDSVLFMLRGKRLLRLNADHSLYGELLEMVSQGKITQAEADANPRRNALRSAVMGEELSLIDLNATALEPGDLILLASDGLETLSDKQIQKILTADPKADVRSLTSDLLNAVDAKAKPKQDNSTVVIYRHVTEGHSGIYRDSRWRLGGGGLAGRMGMLQWGLVAAAALISLALMVWLIAVPPNRHAVPTPVVQQPSAVQRQVGTISGDSGSSRQPTGGAQTPVEPAPQAPVQVPTDRAQEKEKNITPEIDATPVAPEPADQSASSEETDDNDAAPEPAATETPGDVAPETN